MSGNRLLQMSNAVVDLIYQVDHVPTAGGNVTAKETLITSGGGFNAMVAAKRAGMEVVYGGSHGTGPFGDLLRADCAEAGISLRQEPSKQAVQRHCVVLVDDAGERTFVNLPDNMGTYAGSSPASVDPAEFDWLLISGYEVSMSGYRMAVDWLSNIPDQLKLVFDPSPVIESVPESILKRVLRRSDWISANWSEAVYLTGAASPRDATAKLAARTRGNRSGAVVRCGAEGCWVAESGSAPVYIPGFAVATKDTNGAGDTHIGAFIAGLSRGTDSEDAALYANAAAALSTLSLGPATSPVDEDTQSLLASHSQCQKPIREGLGT